MRSVWNGTVSFGLVSMACKLYAATEDHDLDAHQVHAHDGGRIGYAKMCKTCGVHVSNGDIAKQYEIDGRVATLTEEDLAVIAGDRSKMIEVKEFVPASDIDPVMIGGSYYLAPDNSVKAYVLLAQVLKDAGRVAIVQFTMRSKTHLAALTVTGKNDVMVLHTLRWPDEVREPAFKELDTKPELSDAEVKAAAVIVKSMHNEFNPDRYRDTYREELRELVLAKAEDPGDTSDDPGASDLLSKLTATIAAREQKACEPDIRSWARANGYPVGKRGRIPTDIVDKYKQALPA